MNFSRFFIDRPIFAIVLSIVIFAAGLITIPLLPSGEYPEVIPPSAVVRATYPGANPKEIAESVAQPLEEAINGVEGIMYMKSIAGSDGSLQIVVTFRPGTDPDMAAVRVQNRVSQALSRLPEEVRQFGVTTQKTSPTPLMYAGLYSPDGSRDALYLRNYLLLNVKDELTRLPGIGDVQLMGAGDYAMRIWLDPNKLAARDLTAAEVISAIREQNIQVSAGQLGAEPSPRNNFLVSINVRGRLRSEQEFEQIILKTGVDGQVVRLADVARIELGAGDYTIRSYLDKHNQAVMGIFLTPDANALAVADAVYAKMDELTKNLPQGVSYRVEWDPTVFVRESIQAVQHTLIEAIVLVVLVVVVFLQTWRASIIPLIAVPVSIVGTFAGLYLLGYSINTLTLFGLVLAIGIVVDDAIVVVENVERNIELGMTPIAAAHQAMREVSGPIIAIGLVLCAVFVPMSFLSGVTGQFYKQFAVTIAISTVISTINSLTLSPALAAKLLKPHAEHNDWLSRIIHFGFGWFFRGFNRLFHKSSDKYQDVVAYSIRHRGVVFAAYAILLTGAGVLFNTVPSGFIPTQDKLYLFAGAKLPEGSSLSRTDVVTQKMVDIAKGVEGVDVISAFAGFNALQLANTPNTTNSYIVLKHFDERQKSASEIVQELNHKFADGIQDGFSYAMLPPPIQGLGNGSGYSLYLEDQGGLGYGALQDAVNIMQSAIVQIPGMTFPVSAYQANIPQLEIEVDRTKAKAAGVELTDIYVALQTYLGSMYVNDFNLFGRVYRVVAQADSDFRQKVDDIGNLRVRNAADDMVPIAAMINIKSAFGPDPVIRYNGYPAADLIGDADSRVLSSGEVIAKIEEIAERVLPPGIEMSWTDLSYQQVTQSNSALLVFPLAAALVFFVLAALYESWSMPFAVILIVPVCIFAALVGVWLSGGDNNVFVQVGLVVLMGLACKNAILIVEFARELEMAGKSTVQAALEACHLRLRPIIMTSVAFIAGAVPLLLGEGAGSEVRQVTGVTVFAGMLGVTLFGLFLTPVFYVVMRRLSGAQLQPSEVNERPGSPQNDDAATAGQ